MRDAYTPRLYDDAVKTWPHFAKTIVYDASIVAAIHDGKAIEVNTAGTFLPHPTMWLEFTLEGNPSVSAIGVFLHQEAKQVQATFYFKIKGKLVCGSAGVWEPLPFDISDEDRIADGNRRHEVFGRWEDLSNALGVNLYTKEVQVSLNSMVEYSFRMALLALRFLNCKNITTITREGPATINERRKREGKPPYTSYKVLKLPICDQTLIVNANQNNDKNSGLTRLHVCRGHFKTYTKDKPLMGRHTGTYWWPQLMKGKKENGEVIKDYKIEMTNA